MLVRIIVCLIMLLIAHSIVAQQQPVEDFMPERANKKAYHYIGLQANQLIRQLFSFGGNPGAVVNPYLLTYSVNSMSNGFGFATGIGYSTIQTRTNDVFNSTISKIQDFAIRVGMEKKTYLSKRWLVGFGGDILVESNKAETSTANSGSIPNPEITTKASRKGFGPRVTLHYQFHDRLLVGTEASFYMKWIEEKQSITNTPGSAAPSTNLKSFTFTLPAVVFLVAKL